MTHKTKARPIPSQTLPEKRPLDILLVCLTVVMICVGIIMVYDASYAFAIQHFHGDSYYFVKRQALWAAGGLVALLVTCNIPYWRWKSVATLGVAICAFLLLAVLIPHVGILHSGGRRWLGHGAINIQPSELAKLALIVYLARAASVGEKTMRDFKKGVLPPLIVLALLAALIAKEPDMGTAMVLSGTGLLMLCLAGARPKHMAALIGSAAGVAALYAVTSPYRMQRLTSYLNPERDHLGSGYQVWHALIALGSGGVAGFGLGEGREKLYLPMAYTDFIFPVLAEEWGLIGTMLLITLFVLMAWRGFMIAYHTKNTFGTLLAAGLTILISLQALLNISVATALLPDTGVPLPFISYGGSSLVLMMACVGLLLNISRYPDGPDAAKNRIEPNEAEWDRRWGRDAGMLRPEYRPTGQASAQPGVVRRLDRAKRRNSVPTGRE